MLDDTAPLASLSVTHVYYVCSSRASPYLNNVAAGYRNDMYPMVPQKLPVP